MSKKIATLLRNTPPRDNSALIKILKDKITALKQEGDIEKIGTSLGIGTYETIKSQCLLLSKEITNYKLPLDNHKALLFELELCRAVLAFRADDFDNHTKHLTRAYKDYNPGRDQSIIELGEWNTRYKSLSEDQQKKMSSISSLHSSLLTDLTTTVKAFIAQEKYDEAFAEMKDLLGSSNIPVVKLYASIYIARNDPKKKDLSDALEHYKGRIEYKGTDETTKKFISTLYKDLADKFTAKGDKAQANEATKIAETYYTATVPVSPDLAKAQQEVKELQAKYAASLAKLGEVESNNETEKKRKELAEKNKRENDEIIAGITAEYQAKIDALTAKMSPTIETVNAIEIPVKAGGYVFATAPPPSYSDAENQKLLASLEKSNYLKIAPPKITEAGSVVPAGDLEDTTKDSTTSAAATSITTIVSNAAQEEIDEITKIFNSETPNIDRVKVLCKKAIGKQDDLYDTINDHVFLLSLASGYLALEKSTEARKAVDKVVDDAIKNAQYAYDKTKDSSVLNLIAEEYKEQGFVEEFIEANKKITLQPGYTPCAKNYQLLKELGEEKKATDKGLALKAFNVAKDHATTLQQKIEISMSIMNTYCSLNKIDEAKKVYEELLNNTTYQTIYKAAKSREEIALLATVDNDFAKYKSGFVRLKDTPNSGEYENFYAAMKDSPKCELQVACWMEVNIVAHSDMVKNKINEIMVKNPNNTTISQLFKCYNPHYSQTEAKAPYETYVNAIGEIDQTLEHYLFGQ